MKRLLSCFFCLAAVVMLLSNFTSGKTSKFIMTMVNGEPDLPTNPFRYNDVEIPDHLLFPSDTITTGYEMGDTLDTLTFTRINNFAATLGRVLFYDEKLSAQENISCATCHDQSLSFTENKSFSEGILSDTKRNSMHLNDLGWSNKDHFAWDMRESTLKEMILLPLTDENEIGADMDDIAIKLEETGYYSQLFKDAYGDSEITEDRIIDALVEFITSMNTFNSRFDQEAAEGFEGFTSQEQEGMELFSEACGFCHTQGGHGLFFIDIIFFPQEGDLFEMMPFFFNNGLPVDDEDAGAGEWKEGFEDLFKVPTLRNIELTAPYMHDGRFESLEEVVDHYSEGVVQNEWSSIIPDGGFDFSDDQKESLIAFMETLTDRTFGTEEKWSDPFGVLGTDRLELESVVLRPNPTIENAYIEFENNDSRMVAINILSGDGKLIKHDQTTGSQYVLEKDYFGPGLYYIELIMDDRRSIQKLIVK